MDWCVAERSSCLCKRLMLRQALLNIRGFTCGSGVSNYVLIVELWLKNDHELAITHHSLTRGVAATVINKLAYRAKPGKRRVIKHVSILPECRIELTFFELW